MIPDVAGFEDDVKPLFRERDRGAMLQHFDLWSYEDVKANAPAILDVLRAEQMPCDGPWPSDQIETFAGWVADGMAP